MTWWTAEILHGGRLERGRLVVPAALSQDLLIPVWVQPGHLGQLWPDHCCSEEENQPSVGWPHRSVLETH